MDWLRRNWPDLLIGVALVAVIAGIIATLISGGSFFPVGQGDRTTSPPAQISPTTPGSPSAGSSTTPSTTPPTVVQSPSGDADADPSGATTPTATDDSGSVAAAAPGSDLDASVASGLEDSGASGVSALPPGADGPVTPPTTTGDSAVPVPITDPAPSTASSGAQPPSSQPSSSPAAAPPVSASAAVDEASYRVAVGAFGNADNAQRLAQTFQAEGYPVLLGTQGNLTIVLVGPYESEAEARRVAAAVRAGNFDVNDPVVHRYEPEAGPSSPGAGTPAAGSSAAAATPAPAPAAAAPSATSSNAGRYLQVGAYANRESSLPQRELLEEMGFTVSEDTEGNLLRLLIGPFQGSALSDAQSRLAAEGIENFAR